RVHPVPFVDGLPANDAPPAVAAGKEVVEPARAHHVDLNAVHHRALVNRHLRLRDGPVAAHADGAAAAEMENPPPRFQPAPASRDEVPEPALEPRRRHVAVVMPYPGEAVPVPRVAP